MTVEVSTKNYELVVRYNEDGKIGALLRTITSVTDSGALITPPRVNDPQQLDLEALKAIVNGLDHADWFVPAEVEG